jgi:hypothetical protein
MPFQPPEVTGLCLQVAIVESEKLEMGIQPLSRM